MLRKNIRYMTYIKIRYLDETTLFYVRISALIFYEKRINIALLTLE